MIYDISVRIFVLICACPCVSVRISVCTHAYRRIRTDKHSSSQKYVHVGNDTQLRTASPENTDWYPRKYEQICTTVRAHTRICAHMRAHSCSHAYACSTFGLSQILYFYSLTFLIACNDPIYIRRIFGSWIFWSCTVKEYLSRALVRVRHKSSCSWGV